MLFRSKAKQKDDKVRAAHDTACGLLMTQLHMGGVFDDQAAGERLITPQACGYMFGFADAMLQRAGVTDELAAMAELAVVYVHIFGVERGSKIFRASLDIQTDNEFAAGRALGAKEALEFLADKSAPLGLTDYLHARP
jgi:hypothetical protein